SRHGPSLTLANVIATSNSTALQTVTRVMFLSATSDKHRHRLLKRSRVVYKSGRDEHEVDCGNGNNFGDCQQLRADHCLREMQRTIAENDWLDPAAPRHEVPAMRRGD